MNRKLSYQNRCLRIQNGKLLMGPAGNRLYVDYLDKAPGFRGRIDYLHKLNMTEIFAVDCLMCQSDFRLMKAVWYPEYLEVYVDTEHLFFREIKYITEDDCAVSLQHWVNKAKYPISLSLSVAQKEYKKQENRYDKIVLPETNHKYRLFYIVDRGIWGDNREIVIKPNESFHVVLLAAFGILGKDKEEDILSRIKGYEYRTEEELITLQRKQYYKFYEKLPVFICDNELLNRTWEYRQYILKNTYVQPDYGNYKHGLMYEGRAHKMGKEPYKAQGWEFTKLIPLSTALHITDMKWHGEKKYVQEMLCSLLDSMDENGEFRVMTVDEYGGSYGNYSVWAFYQYYLIHPDQEFLLSIINRLKKHVYGLIKLYTDGKDYLQIVKVHQLTGKEYQPSYWYFHDFPKDYKNKDTYDYLKRVDSSIYLYLNLLGLAGLCRMAGEDAADLDETAKRLKEQMNKMMWDEDTEFYYDLHWKTNEKALVKNIVGFYPWWAQITDSLRQKGFETLFGEEFKTDYMFPSVSKRCKAYAPCGGWMGDFLKGRDGCVWNGPSWPYTNAIMLEAIAVESKKNNHKYDREFKEYLYRFSGEHFRNGNVDEPYLVEHYNPETGELLSDEVDYNHSFFLNLIMEHVVGLQVKEDKIVVHPIDIGLEHFRCGPIFIREHCYRVEYLREEYFIIYKDGKEALHKKKLGYGEILH